MIKEKEENERVEMEIKLEEIRLNHAARVIQRGWKKFVRKRAKDEAAKKQKKKRK
jgi:hypothetical protein